MSSFFKLSGVTTTLAMNIVDRFLEVRGDIADFLTDLRPRDLAHVSLKTFRPRSARRHGTIGSSTETSP